MSTDPDPTPTPDEDAFDPAKHLSAISGKAYLEVKWRLVWLRDQHPQASVDTEPYQITEKIAIFKALVVLPEGGRATGWGTETPGDFPDYIEKAETKALGRALAALGFGTQFCDDHAEGGSVVDSPVDFRQRPRQGGGGPRPATERQIKAIYAIGHTGHLSDAQIVALSQQHYGCHPEQLDGRAASGLIDLIKQEINAAQAQQPQPAPAPRPAPAATPAPASAPIAVKKVTAAPGSNGERPSQEAFNRFWHLVKQQNWQPADVVKVSQDCYSRGVDRLAVPELDLLQQLVLGTADLKQDDSGRPVIVPLD